MEGFCLCNIHARNSGRYDQRDSQIGPDIHILLSSVSIKRQSSNIQTSQTVFVS